MDGWLKILRVSLILACFFVVVGIAAGESENFTAAFDRGCVVGLTDHKGNVFVQRPEKVTGAGLHLLSGDHWAGGSGDGLSFKDLPGGKITCSYAKDEASGDLVITQHATSPEKGLWGVEWSIENIPLDMNIIVPGNSGVKLTRETPSPTTTFDYPMSWEAQLVIVEKGNAGFCVWADDARGVFKRLVVERNAAGWRLRFITMPFAPFEDKDSCESVKWRLNVYEGDWRVPARRYREWLYANFGPAVGNGGPLSGGPLWAKEIRCCVIMGQDLPKLEALALRLDPKQTLLYLPGWRAAGYDRNYPEYDKPVDSLAPFVQRAHELGFRVMLHVNYFGCDPLNPAYAQFEPYQVRNAWGKHDKEWWEWTRATPVIKFAYINPAYKPWRDLFVSRMAELTKLTGADAFHLDQTLCMYNDYNGLIDGMSMMDGNIALHRQLRESLPEIALSGEGLDEITCRYEAFAQRHAWGLNHADGTYNVELLRAAHPISSYILRPKTCMYGYLGYAPPTDGAMYSAWNEAYRHWGIIPTLKPDGVDLKEPTGFARQFFDEAALWQGRKLDIDLDSPWPADVAFPLKASEGTRVVYTSDRRLLCGDQEISRTITGVAAVELPGTIPGWHVYNKDMILGLDKSAWYPYFTTPRDMAAFHVTSIPEGFTAPAVAARENIAFVRTARAADSNLLLAELIHQATCGSHLDNGGGEDVHGDLFAPNGALFTGNSDSANGGVIQAHPPYKQGTGIAYARFSIHLPSDTTGFISEVAMDPAAVGKGKTDGVTYGVRVEGDGRDASAEVHNATADHRPLALDLKSFAGKDVVLELTVGPGPNRNPSYDWARWYGPRIERDSRITGEIALADSHNWALALTGKSTLDLVPDHGEIRIKADFPGSVYLLRERPNRVSLPLDIASARFETAYVDKAGTVMSNAQFAEVQPGKNSVGSVERNGLFAHPPNYGQTVILAPMTLPESPARFRAFVGLRDGSKSDGAIFIVEVNGTELAREKVLPGPWHEMTCDLAPWANQPAVLTLITDSDGAYNFDWCCWGEPALIAEHAGG